jgi:hypothetical protein
MNQGRPTPTTIALQGALFGLQFEIAYKLQDLQYQTDYLIAYRKSLVDFMTGKVQELNRDNFAVRQNLPILENRCPVDKQTKREEVKKLVFDLSSAYPDLKERIFGAMQRYPLPEWEPQGRYKRPKVKADEE